MPESGKDLLTSLSPSALKLRDRFRDLVGFDRRIIHELGHAVVAVHLGQPLFSVTIEPEGNLAGACMYEIRPDELGTNALTAAQAIVTAGAKAAVVTALIGCELSAIELSCSIDSHHDEYGIDEDNLRAYARLLQIPDAGFAVWRSSLMLAASEILQVPSVWTALMMLARELKRKRTLSGARVGEVLGQCIKEGALS